jgi:DNA polymerase IV
MNNSLKKPWIIHIDGDGFFAYCEIARFPELKGKPVVAGQERGIACAMTYEAKALGVTRGMPIFKIREQFPEVTIVPCHFELYEHYARKLYMILEEHLEVVERYSIDECFGLIHLPEEWSTLEINTWLKSLKNKVQSALGITYSFGIARTKVLAKIASKYQKPDGCTVLSEKDEESALKETKIGTVWGIGYRMTPKMLARGIHTAWHFINLSENFIVREFNAPIQHLWYELKGEAVLSVGEDHHLPKSLQSTKSFTPASKSKSFVIAELMQNIDIVTTRMRSYGVMTKAVSFFFKTTERRYHHAFTELPYYTDSPSVIAEAIREYLSKTYKNGTLYKATGITVWWLIPNAKVPDDFFEYQKSTTERGKIYSTVDSIRNKFGKTSIGILAALPSTLERIQKKNIQAKTDQYIYHLPLPYLGEVT